MTLLFIAALLALAAPVTALIEKDGEIDNSTVETDVEITKYLGTWYEIARFDHIFERNMTNTTATYIMNDDGTVKVINEGWKNGREKASVGHAKLTDNPALLRVSFMWPFYSDYRIMMLTPDYQNVLVGSKSGGYLWIMSRNPQMPYEIESSVVEELTRRGYDPGKLIWVDQSVNVKNL